MKIVTRVLRAYKKLNWTPILGCWITESNKECCPLTAIVKTEVPANKRVGLTMYGAAIKLFGQDYVNGFVDGVDGDSYYNDIKEKYKKGFNDGQLVRAVLIEKGKVHHYGQ